MTLSPGAPKAMAQKSLVTFAILGEVLLLARMPRNMIGRGRSLSLSGLLDLSKRWQKDPFTFRGRVDWAETWFQFWFVHKGDLACGCKPRRWLLISALQGVTRSHPGCHRGVLPGKILQHLGQNISILHIGDAPEFCWWGPVGGLQEGLSQWAENEGTRSSLVCGNQHANQKHQPGWCKENDSGHLSTRFHVDCKPHPAISGQLPLMLSLWPHHGNKRQWNHKYLATFLECFSPQIL